MKKSENHTLTLKFNFSGPSNNKKLKLGLYEFYDYALLYNLRDFRFGQSSF